MKKKLLPQCCALDEEGKMCRKRSAIKHYYHGNEFMYRNFKENDVTWVEINVCPEHAIAIND